MLSLSLACSLANPGRYRTKTRDTDRAWAPRFYLFRGDVPLLEGLKGDRTGLRPGVPGETRAEVGPAPRADARPGVVGGARSATPADFPAALLGFATAGAVALAVAADFAAA